MKIFNYRVYYEDTDAGGIVYYANYLKFYERARTDFLRAINISQNDLAKSQDLIFVASKCQISYKKPARLDDMLKVSVEIEKIGSAYLDIFQQIYVNEILINECKIKIAAVSYSDLRPKRIMDDILNKFKYNV
jgi:acyl-CoA thioester hydrolase